MEIYIPILIGGITFIGGLISLYYSRRTPDAFGKLQETLEKLQERNDHLYQENVTLQMQVTEINRVRETLQERLKERDVQLASSTKQLDLLRELAKDAPFTETIKGQLEAMSQVIAHMQTSETELRQLLKDKEHSYKELFDSTHDLIKAEKK